MMGGTYHLRAVLVHAVGDEVWLPGDDHATLRTVRVHAPGDEVWLPGDDHATLVDACHALAAAVDAMVAAAWPPRAVVWVITRGDDPRPVVVGLADDRTDWLDDHGLDVEAIYDFDGVTWAWVAQ